MSEVATSFSRDVSRLVTLPELVKPDGIFADGDWIESKDQDPDGDVRLIQLADVGEGVYRDRSNRFLTMQKAQELNCTFLERGDILIARMPDPLGRACIFPGDAKPSVTAVDVCIVRSRSQDVNPRWLLGAINSPQFRSQVAALQSGTTRKRISRKNLGSIKIPVPPKDEQDLTSAIVEQQFTRLDAAVAALQRSQRNLKRFRASVFYSACTGQLAGGASAEGWGKATVDDLAEFVQYGTSAKTTEERYGVPVLRMGNIDSQGNLRLDKLKFLPPDHDDFPALLLQPGDVLFNRTNSAELVGKSAVYKGDPSPCSFASYLIRVRLAPGYIPEFLGYYINSGFGRAWIRRVVSQQVGQANVSGGKLKSLEVPVPPLPEQERIVLEAERQFSIVNELEAAIDAELGRSRALRQSILSEAFSGRLVTNENDRGLSVR